jgi:serine/threonine protein phosphatase 1
MTEGRTVAVGDVHGCPAAPATLVRAIDPTPPDLLVFPDGHIDRGPDSRGVLEQVLRREWQPEEALARPLAQAVRANSGCTESRYARANDPRFAPNGGAVPPPRVLGLG